MTPAQTRSALTHGGTALGAAIATAMWLASHKVDLYSAIDQVNVIVAEIAKLMATVTPLITGAYAVWKASTGNKLADVAADPAVPHEQREQIKEIAATMAPPQPGT